MAIPIAILAGGLSSRMGVDKAALPVGGLRMLEHVAAVAGRVAEEVVVVGRAEPDWWDGGRFAGVGFIPDAVAAAPGAAKGPIAGVIAALRHFQRPTLVLACDMPALRPETLRDLLNIYLSAAPSTWGAMARSSTAAGVILEPMLAVYSPAALPTLETMWQSGRRALYRIAERHPFLLWDVPPGREHELTNLNDPAAYEAFLGSPKKG